MPTAYLLFVEPIHFVLDLLSHSIPFSRLIRLFCLFRYIDCALKDRSNKWLGMQSIKYGVALSHLTASALKVDFRPEASSISPSKNEEKRKGDLKTSTLTQSRFGNILFHSFWLNPMRTVVSRSTFSFYNRVHDFWKSNRFDFNQ